MKPMQLEQSTELPDLTPMIDIVFLLIVFFMTVASLQVKELIPITVPVAETASLPEDRSNRIVLTLKEDGSIFYGSQVIEIDEITPLIFGIKQINQDTKLYIRADAKVSFKEVRQVFSAAAEGGVLNVIFATYQSDK